MAPCTRAASHESFAVHPGGNGRDVGAAHNKRLANGRIVFRSIRKLGVSLPHIWQSPYPRPRRKRVYSVSTAHARRCGFRTTFCVCFCDTSAGYSCSGCRNVLYERPVGLLPRPNGQSLRPTERVRRRDEFKRTISTVICAVALREQYFALRDFAVAERTRRSA